MGLSVQLRLRYGVSAGVVWDLRRPNVSAVRGRMGESDHDGGASPADAGIFAKRETSVAESSLSFDDFAAIELRPRDRNGAFYEYLYLVYTFIDVEFGRARAHTRDIALWKTMKQECSLPFSVF